MKPYIVSYRSTTVPGANGQPVAAIEVTYKVGDYGPFTETFPKTSFSAANVSAKLQDFAAHIQQLHQ